MRELLATAALLGASTSEPPPATVRERVLAAARQTPQDARVTEPAEPAERVEPTPVVALRPRRSLVLLGVAAAVLAVAVVGVGVWGASAHRSNADLVAQSAELTAVLTAPDAATVTASVSGSGRGTVVTSREQATSVFVGADLPIPAADRTYQLWYIDSAGTAQSAGTFVPASDGSVVQPLSGTTPASTTTIGLTVEPAGGSSAPTSTPVLAVTLPA